MPVSVPTFDTFQQRTEGGAERLVEVGADAANEEIAKRRQTPEQNHGAVLDLAVRLGQRGQGDIRVRSGGQGATSAPFLENIRLNLFPGNQSARLVLQFEDVTGLETKLFSKLARNFDLAVLSQDRIHGIKVRAGAS
jgi:hypothetical protein